jgi:hypothetical protein
MGEEEDVWGLEEKAHRVLRAATVESYGRSGAYVTRERVMRRAGLSDLDEFYAIAEFLERRGWIAESDADYGVFIVTVSGIDEAMH